MKDLSKTILLIILILAGQSILAQSGNSEFLKREVKIDNETYGYRVFVPKDLNLKKKTPVIMYLHGNGANGTDNELQIEGFEGFISKHPALSKYIIVFPQARPNMFWIGPQTKQAIKALDQTIEEFNGDKQRVYLTGHSMGGYGTWTTAVLYPNKFTALIPIAGGIIPPFKLPPIAKLFFPKELVAILDSPNPYQSLAAKIGNIPVWDFHGADDEAVPVKESRNIIESLRKNGNKNVKYTEYPKVNHNDSLMKALSEPKLYQWMANQKLTNK